MNAPSSSEVIRLSQRDQQLISAGLSWIVANYDLYRAKGQVPNGRPDRGCLTAFNKGIFDQRLADRVLALHARISSLIAGGRLRASASMEFAACALAVRVAVTRHRHKHRQLNIADIDASSARLLRRLETVRKRAKRAEILQLGADGYREAAHAWRDFATWLRVHLLDCRCKQKRRASPVRCNRVLITQFTQWARAELIDRKHKLPDDRELRRLVRLALSYVRRFRTRHTVLRLSGNKRIASEHFANFVILHDEKAERKKRFYEQNYERQKQNAKTYSSPWSDAD